MSLFAAWVLYPIVLLALCAGLGLLVDALSGRGLSGALIAPVGLAAIVIVGQFTTLTDATAELTVPVLVIAAVAGAGLSVPWRFSRPERWAVGLALAVFGVFAAPVVLSGDPTFAGYIKLDDTSTWLALTDQVMEHGRNLDGLAPSTYSATLTANLPGGYPVGVFLPFGAAQKLVGGDLAWVFQPYLSFLAAMLALSLWQILAGLLRRPPERALAAFVAAQPALLFGYALWGGIKEVAAAAFVALAVALAMGAVRRGATRADAVLLSIPAAALVGVLSFGGLVWLGPMLLALAAIAWRRLGSRAALSQALGFALPLLVLSLPIFLAGGFDPFQAGLTEKSEIGNLGTPLNWLQAIGVWPSGDFRVDPSETVWTAIGVALAILAALCGLVAAWRRRAIAPLLLASTLIGALAIVLVGSPWVDAKALAVAGPAVLTLAMSGGLIAFGVDRIAGAVLVLAIAGGVIWSNVLAYGGVSLAPYSQLVELEEIGEDFAGQGPALMTEYSPYGARHFLRRLDAESASELRVRPVPLTDGSQAEKGEAVDIDDLDSNGLLEYRTLVLRRSPVRSRPLLPYRLVRSGDYYEVWQRPVEPSERVLGHLPGGYEGEASGVPSCSEITAIDIASLSSMFAIPEEDIRLVAVTHAPIYNATDGNLSLPRAGVYEAWLKGSVRGEVELWIDDRKFGDARHVLSNDEGFIELGEGQLSAGDHQAQLRFEGADLHPGSGGFPRPETGPLLFAPAGAAAAGGTVTVAPEEAKRLCGKSWDWIEVIGSTSG